MPIFEETRDAVANSNYKVVAEGPTTGASLAQHLAAIDAVDRQRTLGVITNAAMMEALGQRSGIDVSEASGTARIAASSTADLMAQLGGVVAALQQIVKTAQSTPPVT